MNLPEESIYEQPPTGTHNAICIGFYDLGTQQTEYQGEASLKHQVFIRWELTDELMSDERPFTIGQFYTWSMSENAKLRGHLEAWRNKPFEKADLGANGRFNTKKLLGVPCTLVVGETEKGRTKVTSVGPKMKGVQDRQPQNELIYVALTKKDFDPAQFDKLTDKMKEIVRKSPEYREVTGSGGSSSGYAAASGASFDDDIPFVSSAGIL